MKKILILTAIFLVPMGYVFAKPVVDPASINNMDKYYRDNAECEAIAKNNKEGAGSVAKDTVVGAGVGAGTGALIGAIGSGAGKKAGYGAVIGGIIGGGRKMYKNHEEYDRIYKNCMRGRGYRVLN